MKSEKNVGKWYDITGERCLKYFRKSQQNALRELPRILKYIPIEATILDIGCGTGKPISKYLSERGYKVIGIDISNKMIECAKKNAPRATFKRMSAYNLRFKKETFDTCVCFFSLIHLEKKRILLVFKKIRKLPSPQRAERLINPVSCSCLFCS